MFGAELLSSPSVVKLFGGFGSGLASGLTGAGPSNAVSGAYGSGLDGSAWAVNFGGEQDFAANQDKSGGVPGVGFTGGAASAVGSVPWYVWAGLAGLVAWRVLKRSKR